MLIRVLIALSVVAIVGCAESTRPAEKQQMHNSIASRSVVVSKESIESDDPYDVVYSNIRFLNSLKDEHFTDEELSKDALRSYYVDYYLAQVNNGGFSQFVYNSGWKESTIRSVREGLQAMGATQHFKLFEKSASILDRLGPDGLEKFFESEYFGENEERDILNEFDDKFYDLSEREDLIRLNSDWLKGLPDLVVMTTDDMKAEVERRAAALGATEFGSRDGCSIGAMKKWLGHSASSNMADTYMKPVSPENRAVVQWVRKALCTGKANLGA